MTIRQNSSNYILRLEILRNIFEQLQAAKKMVNANSVEGILYGLKLAELKDMMSELKPEKEYSIDADLEANDPNT
jgi:hypothetical protein